MESRGSTAAEVLQKLATQGILGGIDLGRFDGARKNQLLIAVTERHGRDELDRLVSALAGL